MIPTLLILGFVAGFVPSGWLVVVVAAIGWPLLLVATDTDSGLAFALAASALGAANAGVGMLAGASVRWLVVRNVR